MFSDMELKSYSKFFLADFTEYLPGIAELEYEIEKSSLSNSCSLHLYASA